MAGGRPIWKDYNEEQGDIICELIMDGMPLSKVCKLPGMPGRGTVIKWLTKYPQFDAQYARARQFQADKLADEIVEIADTVTDPQLARNMIDARKWMAGKMRPQRYGDRVEVEHSGMVQAAIAPTINVLIQNDAVPVASVESGPQVLEIEGNKG